MSLMMQVSLHMSMSLGGEKGAGQDVTLRQQAEVLPGPAVLPSCQGVCQGHMDLSPALLPSYFSQLSVRKS